MDGVELVPHRDGAGPLVLLRRDAYPRPEDFPVMPVERTGFSVLHSGIFDRNPALDLPPRGLSLS